MDNNLLDKVIDAATYAKAKSRYTTELQKLEAELERQGSSQSEFQKFLKTGIHLLEHLTHLLQKEQHGDKTGSGVFDLSRKDSNF